MRYSPVFVEQIVQFAFSNVEREIADENGRHDVVVVDVDDDAELPNWGSRVFLFKNDDNNTYTNTDKNKTPLPVVVLCAKRVCRKVSVCVCVLCDDDDRLSLSLLDLMVL